MRRRSKPRLHCRTVRVGRPVGQDQRSRAVAWAPRDALPLLYPVKPTRGSRLQLLRGTCRGNRRRMTTLRAFVAFQLGPGRGMGLVWNARTTMQTLVRQAWTSRSGSWLLAWELTSRLGSTTRAERYLSRLAKAVGSRRYGLWFPSLRPADGARGAHAGKIQDSPSLSHNLPALQDHCR